MGRMGITQKFTQQVFDAFNRVDLDIDTVAALLCNSGPAIKVKAFRLASRIILNLAMEYDYGDFGDDDDETRVLIMSKQITDSVEVEDAP